MNKWVYIAYLLIFLPIAATYGQQGNNWVFTTDQGLNFNYDPPKIKSKYTGGEEERVSLITTISDCTGDLLFYANNCVVWNKNGDTIKSLPDNCNRNRPTVLIPSPGNPDQYYWFYYYTEYNDTLTLHKISYTLLDKTKNNGLGGVVNGREYNNIKKSEFRFGRNLVPVRHENGEDFWVISNRNENEIHAYPVDQNGVGYPVKNNVYNTDPQELPAISISPAGDKIAISNLSYGSSPYEDDVVRLYDFNRNNGIINNGQTVADVHDFNFQNGLSGTLGNEFSPDGSKLYFTAAGSAYWNDQGLIDSIPIKLIQVELDNNYKINVLDQGFRHLCRYPYLAPNNIIYIFCSGENYMHSINNPDASGKEADFQKFSLGFNRENYVTISNVYDPSPIASFTLTGNCSDTTVFTNNSDTADVDSVRWYFGDGDSADTWHAHHVYDSSGTYYVQMKAFTSDDTGCRGQVWRSDSVEVKLPATAGYNKDTVSYQCGEATFHLTDTSRNAATVKYDFGDGNFRDTNAFTYDSSGTYYVSQFAETERGCTDTTGDSISIYVAPVPNADFTWNDEQSEVCVPYQLPVTNESSNADQFRWLVNGTELDSGATPEQAIEESGTYDVSLIAYNEQHCPDTLTKEAQITTIDRPEPVIEHERDTLCGRQEVSLTADYNNADQFSWHFHDGIIDHFISTSYTYQDSGSYPVHLVAANELCTDTATKNIHAAIEPYPEAGFSTTDSAVCTPGQVQLNNHSAGAWSYEWEITGPEHASSEAVNPAFELNSTGHYDVQLIARNNQGCSDTLMKENYIEVLQPAEAALETEDEDGCEHVRFHFTDQSEHTDRWQWDFGDGNTSQEQHPYHIYEEEGFYDIQLVASNDGCSDTAYTEEPVEIIPAPEPDFSVSDQQGCTPAEFELSSHADGDIIEQYFTTGRGDTIAGDAGSFTVSEEDTFYVYQHLESSTGCRPKDSQEVIVLEQPVADFSVTDTTKVCGEETWHFRDDSEHNKTRQWWVEDDSLSINDSSAYRFTEDGKYNLQLEARRHFCADTLEASLDVDIRPAPEADFYAPDTAACLPGDIEFANETKHADTYHWNFGKGSPQTTESTDPIDNRYEESGLYTITLEAESDEGCRDTVTRQYYINIVDSVHADFNITPATGCRPLEVTFTNNSYTGDREVSYRWHFDTGDSSFAETPEYTYNNTETGTYEIVMEIDNEVCSDEARAEIELTGFDGREDRPRMHRATVDDGSVLVQWHAEEAADGYNILRKGEEDYRLIAQTDDTAWTDEYIDPESETARYRVEAIDSCGNSSSRSREGRNILLTGEQEDNTRALLNWNAYIDWPSGVADYELERRAWEAGYLPLLHIEDTHYIDEEYFDEDGLGYCYRVRAHQQNSNAESLSNELCLPYESVLHIPNAFSPNDDELNDTFKPAGFGIKDYELRIFNRWGQQLYKTDDMSQGWDGTADGEKLPEGTYLYSIQASGVDYNMFSEEGSVILIR